MTNPNDAAFLLAGDGSQPPTYGLTKREYFAAMALQGLPAWHGYLNDVKDLKGLPNAIAREAVLLADALIAELNKGAK